MIVIIVCLTAVEVLKHKQHRSGAELFHTDLSRAGSYMYIDISHCDGTDHWFKVK